MNNTTTFFTVTGPHFGSEEYRTRDAAERAIRDLIAYKARVFGATYTRDSFKIEAHTVDNIYIG